LKKAPAYAKATVGRKAEEGQEVQDARYRVQGARYRLQGAECEGMCPVINRTFLFHLTLLQLPVNR